MKVVSKESVTRVLGSIEEYKQVACVESKGLDVISLLVRLCHLQSKKISEDDRQVLVDHIKDLISEELAFAQKMELEEAEAILMNSVSPLRNPAQSK